MSDTQLPTTTFTHEKINDLRRRVLRGEEVTVEELRDAIAFQVSLRGHIATAVKADKSTAAATKKAKSAAEKKAEADKLLKDLFPGL